jgi:hypothetical protein
VLGGNPFDYSEQIRIQWDEIKHGTMEVKELGPADSADFTATLVHEFGHACTREDDRRRRTAPCDEWASEACADWYAYKWGFGRLIRKHAKTRQLGHHGALPGQTIEIDGARYRMTRAFCYRCLP